MDPREYDWQMGGLADPYMGPDERYNQPPPKDAAWPQQFLPSPGDPAKWQAPPGELARWPADPNATAAEAAAERTQSRYRNALSRDPRSNQMGALAEMIAPQSPLDYALLASGPVAKAASVPVRAALYGGAMALDPDKAEAMLAGPRSRTANLRLYEKAKDMLLGGRAGPEVRKETNWFPIDPRGNLAYEIPDKGSGWIDNPATIPRGHLPASALAEQIYRHPAAYEAYPDLGKIPVIIDKNLGKGVRGGFDPPEYVGDQPKVYITPASSKQMRSVLGHELLGHGVQNLEQGQTPGGKLTGWSIGGNPAQFLKEIAREGTPQHDIYQRLRSSASKPISFEEYADMLKGTGLEATEKSYNNFLEATNKFGISGPVDDRLRQLAAHETYRKGAGEAAARAIQARMDFGPRKIQQVPFEQSLDVPINEQLFVPRPALKPASERPDPLSKAMGSLADQGLYLSVVDFNKAKALRDIASTRDKALTNVAQWQREGEAAANRPALSGKALEEAIARDRELPLPANQNVGGMPRPLDPKTQLSAKAPTGFAPGSVLRPETALPGLYVKDPQRALHPGIYKDPRVIAAEAAANTIPEHPSLKALLGVTRDDLWEIGRRGTRQGNIEPSIATRANPRGSYAAEAVMNDKNAQRMIDTLAEARKYPELYKGMDAWYVMDPAFQRLVQLVGHEEAVKRYNQFNTVVPMFSPGSSVPTEINRGTAANMMVTRGQFPTFLEHGGTAVKDRGADFPAALRDVAGHAYHSTAQAGPVGRYLESGRVDMTQPKVPLYMQASGVPETGFQTKLPVPDAHFTRSVGMADVRKNANPGASMKTPEYAALGPWYREKVAEPLGIQAVPAQGRMWGTYAPQTGVDTPVGAPKLELITQAVWERAAKLGVDPKKLLDDVLLGKEHALWLMGVPAAGVMGGLAAQDEYR